jgi:hypothetical protein
MSKARRQEEVVEGPAIVTGEHVRDRVLSGRAGAKAGWSRLTVYEKAFRLGQLKCKEARDALAEEARALDRYAAARAFDEGWQICNASFPGGRAWDEVAGCRARSWITSATPRPSGGGWSRRWGRATG